MCFSIETSFVLSGAALAGDGKSTSMFKGVTYMCKDQNSLYSTKADKVLSRSSCHSKFRVLSRFQDIHGKCRESDSQKLLTAIEPFYSDHVRKKIQEEYDFERVYSVHIAKRI